MASFQMHPAPALCDKNIQGDCVPSKLHYEEPMGPPYNCLRQGNPCGFGPGSWKNTCPGYYCSERGIAVKLNPMGVGGQLVLPWLQCKDGTIPDPAFGVCVPDPTRPFQTWSWKSSLADYQEF